MGSTKIVVITVISIILSIVGSIKFITAIDNREINAVWYAKIETYIQEVPTLLPTVKKYVQNDGLITIGERGLIISEYMKLKRTMARERFQIQMK